MGIGEVLVDFSALLWVGAGLQLQLKLLGGYELLTANGTTVRLPTRKSWALLVILAQSNKQESTREELAALLWPRSGEEQARASLRQELAVLRKALLQHGLEPVSAQGEAIRFDPAGMVVDTHRLREFAKSAEEADLYAVTKLYLGEFVAGLSIRSEPFEEWVWVERQNLRNLALDCLLRALDRAEKHQNPERAGCTAKAILEIDRTDETAHRALMRSYWETGRKAEALKQFKRCAEILARELDMEPSTETCDLADRIRVAQRKPLPKSPLPAPAHFAPRTYQASILPAISPPEKREVTLLVFGTHQIETLSSRLDPEELSLRLERAFNLCLQVVTELGGKFANRFGDRMVFTFGYPNTSEHDAKRAVLAAQQAFAGQQASDSEPLRLRCGIAQGETLVTLQSGAFQNLPYFSGAAVFRATALEQMAQASQILVAGNLRKTLESSFELTLVSDAPDGSEAYAVKSERRTSSRFEIQGFTDKLTRLTGRKQELAELKEIWKSARDGSGHVVVLQGEPGIGKSRLLHSFQQEVLPDAPTILQISGSPYHRQSALFPLIQCLQALLGTDQIADAESKQRQISAWLQKSGLENPKFQGVLTVLLSGQTGDRARGVQGPALSQPAPPVEVLTRFFKAISQTQPMILIVEDLHWMDPTTQDLVHSLANQIGDLPVMIVVTLRPETAQKWLKTTPVHMIDLNRLHPQMSEEFVREICPPDWSQDMIDQVVQRSDGVPLYLEELVGAICEAKTGGAETGPLLIPESLQALLMGRIDRLEAAKGILQIASVIGRVFEHGLLARVVDCGEAELEKQLAVLLARKLVYRIGRAPYARYEFKHVLVQEMTYRSILKKDRKQYHLRIAQALTNPVAGQSATAAEVTARHFRKAGKPVEAIGFLETAGKQAVLVSAHQEATSHFSEAVSLAGKLPKSAEQQALELKFLLLLGPQLLAAHGFASNETMAVYARARALGNETLDPQSLCHVLWGLWGYYVVRADIRTATDIGEQFLSLALRQKDVNDVIAGHYVMGVTQFYAGNLADSEQSFKSGLALYQPHNQVEQTLRYGLDFSVTMQAYLSWIYALQGRLDAALACRNDVIAQAEAIKHDFSIGFAHVFVACMYNFLDLPQQAERHASVTAALSVGQGFAQFLAQADIQLGRSMAQAGDARGADRIAEGMQAYFATGAELARPYAQVWLAEAQANKGAVDQGLALVQDTLAFSERSGETYFDAELWRLQAYLVMQKGGQMVDTAEACLTRSMQASAKSGAYLLHLRAATQYAQLLHRQGRSAEAVILLNRAIKITDFSPELLAMCQVQTVLAELSA